jgi:hypothetical protein
MPRATESPPRVNIKTLEIGTKAAGDAARGLPFSDNQVIGFLREANKAVCRHLKSAIQIPDISERHEWVNGDLTGSVGNCRQAG